MRAIEPVRRRECGVGLIEVMISIIIGMLMVLVIYQIYEVSESQKRTITAGSDAQQSAAYSVFAIGRDLAMAGNGIASSANVLYPCAMLRPIPVLIQAGASDSEPDSITVLYGGSSSLSTPVQFKQTSATSAAYVVPGPVGFSPNDVIAAVQGTTCTISTINPGPGSVVVNPATGFATIAHTPVAGALVATYTAVNASLINLGQASSMKSIVYTVDGTGNRIDTGTHALTAQSQLPTAGPVNPIVSEVVNLKAQYGVDTNCNGVLVWQSATGAWTAGSVQAMPLNTPPTTAPTYGCAAGTPSLQQIQAARIAIVTRSAKWERDAITTGSPPGMPDGTLGLFCDPAPTCAFTMALSTDDQHYRFKILETIVPLRNALWNTP